MTDPRYEQIIGHAAEAARRSGMSLLEIVGPLLEQVAKMAVMSVRHHQGPKAKSDAVVDLIRHKLDQEIVKFEGARTS